MIQKSVRLRCQPDAAFDLFTARISAWWPPTHRPTRDPESELFLEPGGRFWERARDGRTAELGRVREWDPPIRLLLDFYLGTSPCQPTEVEIRFVPDGDGTVVTVTHSPKPESRDLWDRTAPVYIRSWEAVLTALVER